MANDSFPWEGTTVGHAASTDVWSAPYSAAEYADVYSKILGSNQALGFVIPGYGNNLKVTANSPTAMSVLVNTGALFVRGRVYENTAQQTLTIAAADATNPRLDRIVARISLSASVQTIEVAVVQGTAAASPSFPSLTQDSTTYEVALFYVYVGAAVTTIEEQEVHDVRTFAVNMYTSRIASYTNLISNSEFLGFSSLSAGSPSTNPPDGWYEDGTATFESATKPTQQPRGRGCKITTGASDSGMFKDVPVTPSTTYTLFIPINVNSGDVGRVHIISDSGSAVAVERYYRLTGSYSYYIVRYTTESDATRLTILLTAHNNGDIVTFGQPLMLTGWNWHNYASNMHEVILFDNPVTDASWSATAKSSASTTIDLGTSFGAFLDYTEIKGIYFRLQANDSGSAAGAPALKIATVYGGTPIVLWLQGLPNDSKSSISGWARAYLNRTAYQFTIVVVATGASTLDATVEIWGIEV